MTYFESLQTLTRTASLLREQPHRRPNIYEVVREVAAIRGTDIPIKDVRSSCISCQYMTEVRRSMLAVAIRNLEGINISLCQTHIYPHRQ